jgi:putative two-component system response regulator
MLDSNDRFRDGAGVVSVFPPEGMPPSGPNRVLVADDDEPETALFARVLSEQGYAVDVARDGESALKAVSANPPDVILIDARLPALDGFEICRRLRREPATRLTPVILVPSLSSHAERIEGFEAGADEVLVKPIDIEELLARVRALARVKHYTDDLDSAASIIMTIALMIESRRGFAEGHCYRMANYAMALGRRLGLGGEDLQTLYRGGFLHDIGMLAIPDPVLYKTSPLDRDEYELIRSHPVVGDGLMSNLRSLQAVRPIVRHHHEHLDGSGYPDGLCGDAIPLLAQIIGVIDIFDAVTTTRPYQPARPRATAVAILREEADKGWYRREIVNDFVTLIESGRLVL